MIFEGYFAATEEAFDEEKEAMLDRIHQLDSSWAEAVYLDVTAAKLCDELQNLKNILSKAHLPILRTREETLLLELHNAQCAFRVRQLRAEIWRLLPHATSGYDTVDYELPVASTQVQLEPDDALSTEFSKIEQRSTEMLAIQEKVFEEELHHRSSDNLYF
jgi:hypothetical protein